MAQVIGFLPPTWELVAPALAQSKLLQAFEGRETAAK